MLRQDAVAAIGVERFRICARSPSIDRVFALLTGPIPRASPTRFGNRDHAFIVAVNCGQAGGTCFCASMDAGPKVETGFDLALTELLDEGRHLFVVEVGSGAGFELLKDLPHRPATEGEITAAERVVARTRDQMGAPSKQTASKNCFKPTPTTRAGTRLPDAA